MWVNMLAESTCWLCTFHWCESTCWLRTSHESMRQHANSTYFPLLMPTPLTQHSIQALRHSLYFRDDFTPSRGDTWWPDMTRGEWPTGGRGVTYSQVRVIVNGHLVDWGVTGMTSHLRHVVNDHLAAEAWPISRSQWLIDTWRYRGNHFKMQMIPKLHWVR